MSPEEGGDPPVRQRGLPAHGMPEQEEGSPRRQEAKEGAPPEQRALLAHGMHGRGGTQNQTNAPRGPPDHCAPPAHSMPKREEGSPWIQEAEEGATPEQRALLAHGMQG